MGLVQDLGLLDKDEDPGEEGMATNYTGEWSLSESSDAQDDEPRPGSFQMPLPAGKGSGPGGSFQDPKVSSSVHDYVYVCVNVRE